MLPSSTFSGKLAEPTVIEPPAPPPPPVDSPVAAVVAVAPPAVSLLELSESEPQAARSINDALAAASVSLSCLLIWGNLREVSVGEHSTRCADEPEFQPTRTGAPATAVMSPVRAIEARRMV